MFEQSKKALLSFLDKYLQSKQESLSNVNIWNKTIRDIFFDFIKNGKMIRGSLVLESFAIFKWKDFDDALKAGAGLELIHSSLLIHDDIMDRDQLRRGEKTVAASFKDLGTKRGFLRAEHFGNSIGITVGDLGFFLGLELISSISGKSKQNITAFVSREISKVCLSQMQDVYGGYAAEEFSEKEILSIYKYKTGRYSISLPLMLGAMLANQPKKTLETLEKLGETMGILFQLKDDELGLFGKKEITGKPVGSDIKENKKTLFRSYLYQQASKEQKEKMGKIFGNKTISSSQIKYIQSLAGDLGVLSKLAVFTNNLENKASILIGDLKLSLSQKNVFLGFLEYNQKRKK